MPEIKLVKHSFTNLTLPPKTAGEAKIFKSMVLDG